MGRSNRDSPEITAIIRYGSLLLTLLITMGIAACLSQAQEKVPLKVFAAGSLLLPFDEAEHEFEQLHPDVDVQIEGHGSIQVIRQVTDLHRPGDMVAVADESLIPDMMFRQMDDSTGNYSDSFIPFGRNEMVIVYTNKSRYGDEIDENNWFEVLSRPDVRVGIANPMLDASGYRALMVTMLAETEYRNSTIFDRVIGDHFSPPLNVTRNGSELLITLPEVMKPSDDHVAVRDGSIYLLSLLETGGIDYAFEYRSVAEGNNLRWISLPPSINLGSEAYADRYRSVAVTLGFRRFSTIGSERRGRPIVYAISIPNTASHPEMARAFADYIINESKKGRPGWPAPMGGSTG
jgi:molybdate/tungstate transport system substrate-binding protein